MVYIICHMIYIIYNIIYYQMIGLDHNTVIPHHVMIIARLIFPCSSRWWPPAFTITHHNTVRTPGSYSQHTTPPGPEMRHLPFSEPIMADTGVGDTLTVKASCPSTHTWTRGRVCLFTVLSCTGISLRPQIECLLFWLPQLPKTTT